MSIAALVVAAAALVVAYLALSRIKSLERGIEEARADTRRQARNVAEALRREHFVLQQLLLRQVSGEPVTAEMVRDGILWRDVDADEARRMVETHEELVIIDVRNPEETEMGHIPGAKLIPVDDIAERESEIPKTGRSILVYCAGGGRSLGVCEELAHKGYEGLHNLTGGFMAWSGKVEKPTPAR